MSIEKTSSWQLGKEDVCRLCQAGSTVSFNWQYAQKNPEYDRPKNEEIYINPEKLKMGTLYQCKNCAAHWYLDAAEQLMNHVEDEKLDIINSWSEKNLKLTPDQIETLDSIGTTPPDLFGNGSEFKETPCQVKTKNGELFECAIVTTQSHAPFEEWREYRLASEINEISSSPYALPLEVRLATTQADEIRMGLAPTFVELSNGDRMVLNWTTNFLKVEGVNTPSTKVCKESDNTLSMPAIYESVENIVYFVADPIHYESSASNKALNKGAKKTSLLGKLKRLLRAD